MGIYGVPSLPRKEEGGLLPGAPKIFKHYNGLGCLYPEWIQGWECIFVSVIELAH